MNQLEHPPAGAPHAKPRGVLRPSFSPGRFEHRRRLPSTPLAGLVEHYWHVSWDLRGLPARQQATLPHPNVHLVIEQGQARIYGVHHGRFVRQLAGQDLAFGIKFKAGGFYPFYREPVASLLNKSIDVTACFGTTSADLATQVLATTHFEAMCVTAEAFLLRHLPAVDAQVARVGPKWVIQRYRLHEAIARVQAGKPMSWTSLALELGYFDQAHLVCDFRLQVGMAPGEYERTLAG